MSKLPPDSPEDAPEGKQGGFRANAKRPVGSGKYGEPTEAIRVPVSLLPVVRAWLAAKGKAPPAGTRYLAPSPMGRTLPLYASRVPAGFPSPADDHQEDALDLNEHLVRHPAATFFVRAKGNSMVGAGIHDGDLLVVDRALEPKSGAIVVAVINAELTVKRLKIEDSRVWLAPENPDYQSLEICDGLDLVIWGVVTNSIHSL
jgi:DNA polymerase V